LRILRGADDVFAEAEQIAVSGLLFVDVILKVDLALTRAGGVQHVKEVLLPCRPRLGLCLASLHRRHEFGRVFVEQTTQVFGDVGVGALAGIGRGLCWGGAEDVVQHVVGRGVEVVGGGRLCARLGNLEPQRLALAFGQVLPFGIDQAPDVAIISTSDKRCQLGFDDGIVSRIWGHALPDARKAIIGGGRYWLWNPPFSVALPIR